MGGPMLGITTLQAWIDMLTASVGFGTVIDAFGIFATFATAVTLVSVAVHLIFIHFGLVEGGPVAAGFGVGGPSAPPATRAQRRSRGRGPGPQTPQRFHRRNRSSGLSVTDARGREYQGSQRIYRERDTGAPLPSEGAFGSWLRSDRD